jgi:hypothetical protein
MIAAIEKNPTKTQHLPTTTTTTTITTITITVAFSAGCRHCFMLSTMLSLLFPLPSLDVAAATIANKTTTNQQQQQHQQEITNLTNLKRGFNVNIILVSVLESSCLLVGDEHSRGPRFMRPL